MTLTNAQVTPRCYWSRRTDLHTETDYSSTLVECVAMAGFMWSVTTFPDAAVWRMDWYAKFIDVHIDDIHAFETAPGKWRYCLRGRVRPFAPYTLEY